MRKIEQYAVEGLAELSAQVSNFLGGDWAEKLAGQSVVPRTWSAAEIYSVIYFRSLGLYGDPQDVLAARAVATAHQNASGNPLTVYICGRNSTTSAATVQISADGATWVQAGSLPASGGQDAQTSLIVPPAWFYKVNAAAKTNIASWVEVRMIITT